ncbi:MAG: hypothetical protein PHS94_03310 [Erysipelotrichaceae bacterium]|nr:hypothetical protein [Erysipelotrichaceae bacterium]
MLFPGIVQNETSLSSELVLFENMPKNAQEIMNNFGRDVDLVAGIYNDNLLLRRDCQALKITDSPIRMGPGFGPTAGFKDGAFNKLSGW